jgi:serine phosphatase RsbU (regulator of sigma subunit)
MYEPSASTRPFSSSLTRDLLVSVLIGVCITLVVHFPSGVLPPLQQWIVAVVISLSIYATARVLFRLLSPWVKRSEGIRQKVLVAGIMVVAGPLGYVLGGTAEMFVRTGTVELPWRSLLLPLLVVAGICIVIGLTLHTFDRQSERLAENVARLKEAEFAERELHLARGLQSRLLPPPEIEGEGYRIAARNLPARVVAGDFYDVFPLAGGALGVVVADVAGKGMAASLIMASVKAMLPLVAAGRTPEETLRELNRRLAAELSPREFVALAYARFNPADGTIALANAGLPDPYLLPLSGPAQAVAVPGPRLPLGVRREVEYRSQELSLVPGERLLFLTDGLAEAPTAAGEPLGYAAFAELLEGARSPAPSEYLDDLLDRVRSATSPTLEDDWTALLLERAAGPSAPR